MLKAIVLTVSLLLGVSVALAQESSQPDEADSNEASPAAETTAEAATEAEEVESPQPGGPKTLSGMSILGNEEAPKSLVIVPWKSSEIGDGLGVTDAIDERARPVDREVFMREVHYYELRSGTGS